MKIVLFTTGCPKCSVLKKKMDMKRIPYTQTNDVDVAKKAGYSTAPLLIVDEVAMPFEDAVKWVNNYAN